MIKPFRSYKYHDITSQDIYAWSLAFFIIYFRVLLTSDVMIGGTSDESGLVFFSEGC